MLGKAPIHFSSIVPITITIGCKSRFTTHSSKVSSSFRYKIAARKAKSCIKLDRIFEPIPPLIPGSIQAFSLGLKHANLLRVLNCEIISISRFSFAHRPTCSRCCRRTAASRRAETLQTLRIFTRIRTSQPISQTHFAPFTSSMNKRNKNICCNC